jgi:hypothetical protein
MVALPSMVLAAASVVTAGGSITSGEVIRTIVVAAWSVAAAGLAERRADEPLGVRLGWLSALGAAGHLAGVAQHHGDGGTAVDLAAGLALGLVLAAGVWFFLAVPSGRLASGPARRVVLVGAATGVGVGLAVFAQRPGVPWWLVTLAGVALAVLALPVAHRAYRSAGMADRRRLQWIGLALALSVEVLVIVMALDVVVGWPRHTDEIAGIASLLIPLSLVAGVSRHLSTRIDRVLTSACSLAGLTAVIAAAYVLVILGFGDRPEEGDRAVLVVSMIAAALAAAAWFPLRERLSAAANSLVYGEQTSPEESLRTFGQRMTRAIPMDELLLQLVESLRTTMRLASAEVWTGSNGQFEVAAGVPHVDRGQLEVGAKEQPVVARAGVSGGTWLDIWLAGLVAGRDSALLRVAPLAHAGELLGLIVMERRPEGDPLSEDDDATVAELARQVALAPIPFS